MYNQLTLNKGGWLSDPTSCLKSRTEASLKKKIFCLWKQYQSLLKGFHSTLLNSLPYGIWFMFPAHHHSHLLGWCNGKETASQRICLSMQEKQETWFQSLHLEDLLEEGMAAYSSILAWRIPWTEESGELQSMGLQRVRHSWARTCTIMVAAFSCFLFKVLL